MKIAWFTPFDKNSAIGRYSKNAAEALAEQGKLQSVSVDVDILTFEMRDLLSTDLRIVHFDNQNIERIMSDYDIAIYNIGNHMEKHALTFDAIRMCAHTRKGIVIAHDLSLHEFFRRYYVEYKHDKETYFGAMERLYGKKEATKIVNARKTLRKWNKLDLVKYSLADELFPYASGIIVHSEYHANMLKGSYGGQICVLPLLYIRDSEHKHDETAGSVRQSDGKLKVLTVGDVNLNKRIHIVAGAIGKNKTLRDSVTYTIIGSMHDEPCVNSIKKLIRRYKLSDTVRFAGYVDDTSLENHYAAADIVINLRNPALEGGSATLIEQMSKAKAVIVSNTGIYSEMPDDCVIKVSVDNEAEDLTQVLSEIVKNPDNFRKYGENAKTFAQSYLSAENYGKKLLEFIRSVN